MDTEPGGGIVAGANLFFEVDNKGLGLGLYLVRSIIRLHGGDITADSVYGEYTEFRFYIPKKQDKKNV